MTHDAERSTQHIISMQPLLLFPSSSLHSPSLRCTSICSDLTQHSKVTVKLNTFLELPQLNCHRCYWLYNFSLSPLPIYFSHITQYSEDMGVVNDSNAVHCTFTRSKNELVVEHKGIPLSRLPLLSYFHISMLYTLMYSMLPHFTPYLPSSPPHFSHCFCSGQRVVVSTAVPVNSNEEDEKGPTPLGQVCLSTFFFLFLFSLSLFLYFSLSHH